MRQIQNHNLAQLLMQLRFTPKVKRQKQLVSAEKLLELVDKNPDTEYPFEFVDLFDNGLEVIVSHGLIIPVFGCVWHSFLSLDTPGQADTIDSLVQSRRELWDCFLTNFLLQGRICADPA